MSTEQFSQKTPQQMSSAELEEAIRQHRQMTQKLLAEARARREAENQKTPHQDC